MWTAGITLCAGIMLFSAVQVFLTLKPYREAGVEYAALRQQCAYGGHVDVDRAFAPESSLTEVNPDYIGWLQIPGTAVDYPVVCGQDNTKYLDTTFEGAANPAGAIFMDCVATSGFDSSHTILYGHNIRDGSMFGGLHRYLEAAYMAQNPIIIVTTPDGSLLTYTILKAYMTDVEDRAYCTDLQRRKIL